MSGWNNKEGGSRKQERLFQVGCRFPEPPTHNHTVKEPSLIVRCRCRRLFGRWRCWSRLIGGRCRSRAVGQHLSRAGRLRVAACRSRLTTTGLLPVAAMPRGPAMPRLSFRADERHTEQRDQTRQRQEFSRHDHSFQQETFVTNTSGLQLRSPRFILKHSRGHVRWRTIQKLEGQAGVAPQNISTKITNRMSDSMAELFKESRSLARNSAPVEALWPREEGALREDSARMIFRGT